MSESLETLIPIIQRVALFGGVLLLAGVGSWRIWIFPRLDAEPGAVTPSVSPLVPRVAGFGAVVTLLLLPVWGLRLYSQLLDFRDPFAPLSEDLAFLVGGTFWGTVWMAQGGILVVLLAVFLLLRRGGSVDDGAPPPLSWKVACGLIVLLVLTLSLSSHAMSVAYNRPLAVAVDGTHTAAAGAWIGSLALILFLHRPGRGEGALLANQLRAFSLVAMVSVGLLVFMGGVLSLVHLGGIQNLWASSYGRVLSLKILVAGGVLFMGFVNWRKGLPVLDSETGQRMVRRRAALEVLLALVVLVLTAILVGTSMPEGVH